MTNNTKILPSEYVTTAVGLQLERVPMDLFYPEALFGRRPIFQTKEGGTGATCS